MKDMKTKFIIIFALAALLILAGCTSQGSGSQTVSGQKTFKSIKDAYDSGLSLKCSGTSGVYTVNMYFSNKNIRSESIGPAQTIYQVITKDNHYYSWMSTSPEKVISMSGDGVNQPRNALLNGPLTIPCTEQAIDSSLFEPPKK